jgi:hypothetical protein
MEEALQEQKRLKDKMDDEAKTFQLLQDELHSLRVLNHSFNSFISSHAIFLDSIAYLLYRKLLR